MYLNLDDRTRVKNVEHTRVSTEQRSIFATDTLIEGRRGLTLKTTICTRTGGRPLYTMRANDGSFFYVRLKPEIGRRPVGDWNDVWAGEGTHGFRVHDKTFEKNKTNGKREKKI